MRARLLSIVGFLTWLAVTLCAAPAQAAPPRLRTSVVPTVGVDGQVHERVSVGTVLRVPVLAEDPMGDGDVASFDGGVFTRIRIKSAFGLSVGYGARVGRWPLDGPWSREHRVSLGLMVSTPERGRLLGVSHRTRVETRFVRDAGPWLVRARWTEKPSAQLPPVDADVPPRGAAGESTEPRADILRRAGLGLAQRAGGPAGGRRGGAPHRQAALRPRAGLASGAVGEGNPAAALGRTQQAVDLVLTLGFGVRPAAARGAAASSTRPRERAPRVVGSRAVRTLSASGSVATLPAP